MNTLNSISTRLAYSEDQAMLRDEARRFLQARAPRASLREWAADDRGDDPKVWTELAQGGWFGLATDAAYGGAGLGAVELVSLVEEAGRVLLPTPLLGQLLVAALLGAGGSGEQKSHWLPRLIEGKTRAVWALTEANGSWRATETTVEEREGRLFGTKAFIWAGDTADLFCLPIRGRDGIGLALVAADAAGVERESETTLDPTRRQGRLRLEGVAPEAILEAGAEGVEEALLPLAWTALAAESVGGVSATLDMTASYAAEREQFGKPIGAFQAIKHPLANVLIATELARSLVYAAACAIDQKTGDAPLLARMAKAAADDAYDFGTSRAIQFHGGFGFTDECDAHLFRRRAMASRVALGDPAYHRREIADMILGPATG